MTQSNESQVMPRVQPPADRVSGRSIAAFVLGLICLCLGPLGVLPIVVGTLALVKPQVRCENQGRGLAIAGIVLGVVGVLGTFVWVAALYTAKERASFLYNQSSLHAHSQGLVVYAENNENRFPNQDQWPDILIDQAIVNADFHEWADKDGDGISYVYLAGQTFDNKNQILIYEDPKHWKQGVLVGFADGHVEVIDHATFERMLAEQLEGQESAP